MAENAERPPEAAQTEYLAEFMSNQPRDSRKDERTAEKFLLEILRGDRRADERRAVDLDLRSGSSSEKERGRREESFEKSHDRIHSDRRLLEELA